MRERVDSAALSAELVGPGRMWTGVTVVDETGSTNADLVAAARAGAPSGQVLIAMFQSSGRGRFRRVWEAPAGSSIALSVLLRPGREIPVGRWSWLPLATGLAVAAGLRSGAGVTAEVKWPNDVLIEGRKVCGILAERVDGESGPAAVVGMGVNISLTEDELPVPTATSLRLAGSGAPATEVALGILLELERVYTDWLSGASLRADYAAGCATIGRVVRILTSPTESVVGLAEGVDADGRLLVRDARGVTAFAAGDVHHLR